MATTEHDLSEPWASLGDALLGEPDYDDAPPELALADRDGANRHLGHIARLCRQEEIDAEVAAATLARLKAWVDERAAAIGTRIAYHEAILDRYHRAVLAIDPRLKTIKLPNGELRLRTQQPQWGFDADEFIPWAQEHLPGAVRTPEPEPMVDVKAAKDLLSIVRIPSAVEGVEHVVVVVTETGEPVVGVEVDPRADPKFSYGLASEE